LVPIEGVAHKYQSLVSQFFEELSGVESVPNGQITTLENILNCLTQFFILNLASASDLLELYSNLPWKVASVWLPSPALVHDILSTILVASHLGEDEGAVVPGVQWPGRVVVDPPSCRPVAALLTGVFMKLSCPLHLCFCFLTPQLLIMVLSRCHFHPCFAPSQLLVMEVLSRCHHLHLHLLFLTSQLLIMVLCRCHFHPCFAPSQLLVMVLSRCHHLHLHFFFLTSQLLVMVLQLHFLISALHCHLHFSFLLASLEQEGEGADNDEECR
jgi:hypothetical protein